MVGVSRTNCGLAAATVATADAIVPVRFLPLSCHVTVVEDAVLAWSEMMFPPGIDVVMPSSAVTSTRGRIWEYGACTMS